MRRRETRKKAVPSRKRTGNWAVVTTRTNDTGRTGVVAKRWAKGVGRKGRANATEARREAGITTAGGPSKKALRRNIGVIVAIDILQLSDKSKKATEPSTGPRPNDVPVTEEDQGQATEKGTLAPKGRGAKSPTDGTRSGTRLSPLTSRWTRRTERKTGSWGQKISRTFSLGELAR